MTWIRWQPHGQATLTRWHVDTDENRACQIRCNRYISPWGKVERCDALPSPDRCQRCDAILARDARPPREPKKRGRPRRKATTPLFEGATE